MFYLRRGSTEFRIEPEINDIDNLVKTLKCLNLSVQRSFVFHRRCSMGQYQTTTIHTPSGCYRLNACAVALRLNSVVVDNSFFKQEKKEQRDTSIN